MRSKAEEKTDSSRFKGALHAASRSSYTRTEYKLTYGVGARTLTHLQYTSTKHTIRANEMKSGFDLSFRAHARSPTSKASDREHCDGRVPSAFSCHYRSSLSAQQSHSGVPLQQPAHFRSSLTCYCNNSGIANTMQFRDKGWLEYRDVAEWRMLAHKNIDGH